MWVSVPVCTCRVRPAYSSQFTPFPMWVLDMYAHTCVHANTHTCAHMLLSNVQLISGGIRILIEQSSSSPHG